MWCHHLGLIEAQCPSMFPYLYEELIESPEALVEDLCRFIGRPLPSNIEELLSIRENASPRSRVGQAVSAMSWPALKLANLSARERLKGGLKSLDSLFSARRVELPESWRGPLRQDWDKLLGLISARRGATSRASARPNLLPLRLALERSGAVIRVAGDDRRSAVDLLGKDDAGKPMGQRDRAERHHLRGLGRDLSRQAVGTADDEGQSLHAPIAQFCQQRRERLARQRLA